jgi:MOSC domain-containing protein YiiM
MQLVSVNVGRAEPMTAKSGMSGIYKRPTADPVAVTQTGLNGDTIVDTANHGGVDQAVYIYTVEDYRWWSAALGTPLEPGTFGENLTIAGIESAALCIGDCFRVGSVVLQVTAPRIPCVTLAARMGDPGFVKKFAKAERPGVYCRVLETGSLCAGSDVTYLPYDGERVSALAMFRLDLASDKHADALRQLLRLPIATRARQDYERALPGANRAE